MKVLRARNVIGAIVTQDHHRDVFCKTSLQGRRVVLLNFVCVKRLLIRVDIALSVCSNQRYILHENDILYCFNQSVTLCVRMVDSASVTTFPYRFTSIITYFYPAPQYATHPAPAIYLQITTLIDSRLVIVLIYRYLGSVTSVSYLVYIFEQIPLVFST